MDTPNIDSINNEWKVLTDEYQRLEEAYRSYQNAINEFNKLQNQCFKEINHQNYRIEQISQSLLKCTTSDQEEENAKKKLEKDISARLSQIKDIKEGLPKSGGLYLKIVMGGINASFLDSEQKFKYKEQYERFKLIVTSIIMVVCMLEIFIHYRFLDAILHFLLVWYHCTLTIRESILVANGSRIKGWWRTLQFLTTIQAGVMIVWPDGLMYNLFRVQFLTYVCYTSFLQFLQFYYQHGCLYRLRALGERYDMDITIQGFHSWMWRGLSFLLPFLYFGYGFQFYNAYTLYKLSYHEQCTEWQVPVTSAVFFALFLGNTLTTSLAIQEKLRGKITRKLSKFKFQ